PVWQIMALIQRFLALYGTVRDLAMIIPSGAGNFLKGIMKAVAGSAVSARSPSPGPIRQSVRSDALGLPFYGTQGLNCRLHLCLRKSLKLSASCLTIILPAQMPAAWAVCLMVQHHFYWD